MFVAGLEIVGGLARACTQHRALQCMLHTSSHTTEANDNTVLFEKILTRSDTNGQGRVVLPKVRKSWDDLHRVM